MKEDNHKQAATEVAMSRKSNQLIRVSGGGRDSSNSTSNAPQSEQSNHLDAIEWFSA
jgi:hypothetical protein